MNINRMTRTLCRTLSSEAWDAGNGPTFNRLGMECHRIVNGLAGPFLIPVTSLIVVAGYLTYHCNLS